MPSDTSPNVRPSNLRCKIDRTAPSPAKSAQTTKAAQTASPSAVAKAKREPQEHRAKQQQHLPRQRRAAAPTMPAAIDAGSLETKAADCGAPKAQTTAQRRFRQSTPCPAGKSPCRRLSGSPCTSQQTTAANPVHRSEAHVPSTTGTGAEQPMHHPQPPLRAAQTESLAQVQSAAFQCSTECNRRNQPQPFPTASAGAKARKTASHAGKATA